MDTTDSASPFTSPRPSQPTSAATQAVQVLARATQAIGRLADAPGRPSGSRDELVEVVAAAQALVNTVTAVQDAAIAHLAAVESAWAEDGELIDVVRPLGHVALDAADLVAPAIGASHAQAQRRVEQAVRVAAGRVPVPDGCREVPTASGLGGLHAAMRQGRLDGYRAGVVAYELAEAPAQVAEAVVAALDPHLGTETAAGLRRRCRRLVARISPDLLRQRAERARRETGLRRWVTEPGVDTWMGSFPSEDAAAAWAAIDDLARTLVKDGRFTSIEQARAKALTDLVMANATATYTVILTVPADTTTPDQPGEKNAATADTTPGAVQVSRQREATTSSEPGLPGRREAQSTRHARPMVGSGGSATERQRGSADGSRSRILDDGDDPRTRTRPHDPSTNPTPTERDQGGDLIEVRGLRPCEPTLVPRGWLTALLGAPGTVSPTAEPAKVVVVSPCHPRTGALLDHRVGGGYRPSDTLAQLVRARDGRCRFPGCSVAARFCDLDHVRAWPTGPTTAANLACLCRRHHRIKQLPGWQVRLLDGAVLQWTDPTGHARTTRPLDALHTTVLVAEAPQEVRPRAAPGTTKEDIGTATADLEAQAFSLLEFHLEHLLASAPAPTPHHRQRWAQVDTSRRAERHGLQVDTTVKRAPGCGTDRPRVTARRHWPDLPPF